MRRTHQRSAFTLIEILIVIAIIGTLAAIAITLTSSVSATQEQRATEAMMRKLDTLLTQQLKAVVDSAREEQIPPAFKSVLCQDNANRARVAWAKYRVRQEFPITFGEARGGIALPPAVGGLLPLQKPTYIKAIGIGGGGTPLEESCVLLTLALGQSRRGVTVNLDEIAGANGFATVQVGPAQHKVLVDSWGKPLAFVRWPWDPAVAAELAAELNAPPNAVNPLALDPMDPESWLTRGIVNEPSLNRQGYFQQIVGYPLPPNGASNNYTPFILSAGRDGAYLTGDDILSFRLRAAGQRGN